MVAGVQQLCLALAGILWAWKFLAFLPVSAHMCTQTNVYYMVGFLHTLAAVKQGVLYVLMYQPVAGTQMHYSV